MSGYNISRRNMLKGAAALAAGGTIVSLGGREVFAAESTLLPANTPVPFRALFRRAPTLIPETTGVDAHGPFAKYRITQRLSPGNILPGLTTTIAGYNGIYPGPTILVNQGTRTEVRIANHMTSNPVDGVVFTSVTHLHGSASLPQYDGYANDRVPPTFVKTYHYPNFQKARTLFYHDHDHHRTAENVFAGIAGTYHIHDPAERAQLPQGQQDTVLVVTDASFNTNGSLRFNDGTTLDDNTRGFMGDIVLVNGEPSPTMKVTPRVYRFRVLVESVSRSYRFALSTGEPFYVVATDAGLTPKVNAVKSWRQGVAERVEVLIDFRKYKVGTKIQLLNLSNKNNVDFRNTDKVMQFEVVADTRSRDTYVIPTALDSGPVPYTNRGAIDTMELTPGMATGHVRLQLKRQHEHFVINGDTWADVERSGFKLVYANPAPFEIFTFEMVNDSGGWFHPLHIHLTDVQIYARNSTPDGKPFAWEDGPKDTFYLGEDETVFGVGQFILGSDNAGGRYMTHCHNLVHEDDDMMVQLGVGDYLHVNNPITADPAIRDTQPIAVPHYAPEFPRGF